MSQPTPLDPTVPAGHGRGLLDHLTGGLPRRRGRPGREAGHAAAPDPFWDVVLGEPDRSAAPRSARPAATSTPAATSAPAPAADPASLASPLARAEGWLAARSGSGAALPGPLDTTVAVPAPRSGGTPPTRVPVRVPAWPAEASPTADRRPGAAARRVGPARPPVTPMPTGAGPAAPAPGPGATPGGAPAGTVLAEVVLTDGRRLPLTTTLLVGRNPAPRSGEPVGGLVAVDDPGRSVSKTHLTVGVDDGGAWVVDRHSTNGTLVTLPDGQQILCVPERRVRLVSGARVHFGEHGFTLLGAPAPDGAPPSPDGAPPAAQEDSR